MRRVNGHDNYLTSKEFDVLVLLDDADTFHLKELSVGKLANFEGRSRIRLGYGAGHDASPIPIASAMASCVNLLSAYSRSICSVVQPAASKLRITATSRRVYLNVGLLLHTPGDATIYWPMG